MSKAQGCEINRLKLGRSPSACQGCSLCLPSSGQNRELQHRGHKEQVEKEVDPKFQNTFLLFDRNIVGDDAWDKKVTFEVTPD